MEAIERVRSLRVEMGFYQKGGNIIWQMNITLTWKI